MYAHETGHKTNYTIIMKSSHTDCMEQCMEHAASHAVQ